MNTKVALGAATAALAIGVGFSEPASALTFKVDAQHVNLFPGGSPTGETLTGSFDFVGGVYSNINLKSTLTDNIYTSLFLGQTSTDEFAYFEDPLAGFSVLKLTFSSALSSVGLGETVSLIGGSTFDSVEGVVVLKQVVGFPLEGSATAVPTPALLPGLIGMGVAALRRKNEESTEENA